MREATILAGLAGAAVLAIGVSVGLGPVGLGPGEIAAALRGSGDAVAVTIVRELRLPRSVLAALVGGALALAGAVFQALLRNPLADPYVLGVSSGAGVGAVIAIALGLAAASRWSVPAGALAGALIAITIVLRIGTSVDRRPDIRILLLAGVVAGTFFNACILLVLSLVEVEAFRSAMFWMMGGLSGATWWSVGFLAVVSAPACAGAIALARSFDLLAVGEETAEALGTPVPAVQRGAYLAASLLTAAAVVVAGGIGFVGLVVPHAVRMAWGGGHRLLLPASFLAGAAFLPLADTLARLAVAPAELPLGVVTAFIGVPFFLLLLRRQSRRVEA